MEQREVQDQENRKWTCVQAYSGPGSEGMKKAAQEAEGKNGKVSVVCTPNGGAQSVRLQLPPGWLKELTDEQLLEQITAQVPEN